MTIELADDNERPVSGGGESLPSPNYGQRLKELVSEYWGLAYAEGREGRNHDTEAGDAQRVLHEINTCIAALTPSTDWVLVGSNEDTRIYKTPEAAAALEAMIMSVTGDEEAEIDVATMELFDGSIQGTARAMMGGDGSNTSVSDLNTRRYVWLRQMALQENTEMLDLLHSINTNPTTNDEFDAVIDEAIQLWER